MKLKRILAMLAVVLLVGMYVATLIFAIIGNGYFKNLFAISLASTIAVPVIIHLGLAMSNVKKGKKVLDNPYSYQDKDKE